MDLLSENADIEYDAVIKVLLKHIKHEFRDTRIAVLNWISRMHITAPAKVASFFNFLIIFWEEWLFLYGCKGLLKCI